MQPVHETLGPVYEAVEPLENLTISEIRSHHLWGDVLLQHEGAKGKTFTRTWKTVSTDLKNCAISMRSPAMHETGKVEWQNIVGLSEILLSILPQVVFVPAIRETKEEVVSSKAKSSIHQIVRVLFERYLTSHREVRSFHAAGEAVKHLFEGARKSSFVDRLESHISDLLRRLIEIEARLRFVPPDVAVNFAGATELWLRDNNLETRPEHQGHGAQRAVVITLLEIMATIEAANNKSQFLRPLLVLIEEPEIYLHPHMCRKMRDTLVRLARTPQAQVICTSHSPVFLDLADRHDGIAMLRRHQGQIRVTQRSEDIFAGHDEERARLRMLLNFDPAVNEVFFTERVCLVEGDTEVAALRAVTQVLAHDNHVDGDRASLAARDVSIVNCRGKATISAFQRVLNAFQMSYRVVHDSDIGAGNSASAEKAARTLNSKIRAEMQDPDSDLRVHEPSFEEAVFGHSAARDKAYATWEEIHVHPKPLSNNQSLIEFFEFCLQTTIAELKEPMVSKETRTFMERMGDIPPRMVPPNRNRRDRMPVRKVETPTGTFEGWQYLMLASGRCRIPDFYDGTVSKCDEGVVGRICGEAMADTLRVDDYVLLELMDFELPPLADDASGIALPQFTQTIADDGIYLVAINEDRHHDQYLLRAIAPC